MTGKAPIRVGKALPGPGIPHVEAGYDYSAILGRMADLKPSGENRSFDASLPRRGTLIRQLALTDWGKDWLVMSFLEPFEYDSTSVNYCLIRARWIGCPIGSKFCPVFVLTDKERVLATERLWSSQVFQFVSWAEVELVER